MNNTFYLEPISKAGSLDANSKIDQSNLGPNARFMRNKSSNPKLTQKQTHSYWVLQIQRLKDIQKNKHV